MGGEGLDPAERVVEAPPVLGEVEVLDRQPTLVAEIVEAVKHGCEVDDAGRVVTETRAGETVAYTYDAIGRKTSLRNGSATGSRRAEWLYDSVAAGMVSEGWPWVLSELKSFLETGERLPTSAA